MPYIESNGLRFHVQVLGGGEDAAGTKRPKVVMLHGLVIDNLSSWFYTLAHPMAQQADVHLADMRGHGRTEIAESGYSVADHVADLLGLLEGWGIDDEPIHFFGNSFGCVVGLALAKQHPEKVASLFLIEAHFSVPGWGEHMAGTLALAAFGLDEVAVREYLATEADRKTSRLAKRTEKLFFGSTLIEDLKVEKPIDWLEEIQCPVFAIYGSQSDILDRAHELDAKVPDCTLEVVQDASHSLLIENSALIKARAFAWLNTHAGTDYEIEEVVAKNLGTMGAIETMEALEQLKADNAHRLEGQSTGA
ncbi:alpha/beta fold hydrolase [Nocardioides sp. Y6]|uniref:Alpha/beta fold hydrolase n=1 Tax=Nocardioides malaquae TaxID=2773426 RepID=A0ABR9RR98_9ACTN|nr:alpha/beta hydrolase [Nocardioides malaquae]MBE7324088.1 alpha/beta fold hydrolase [Nocardioides malaquae]